MQETESDWNQASAIEASPAPQLNVAGLILATGAWMEHLPDFFMTESDSVPGVLMPEKTYVDQTLLLDSTGRKNYIHTYSFL